MHRGQTISPGKGERITCIQSGIDGSPFIFDFELDPGIKGPPLHTHEEHDERITVLSGEFGLQIGDTRRVCRAGESVLLKPQDPHTFWNASSTSIVRCRVEHGGRFERAIIQPDLVRLAMFINDVDPGAIRVHNAALRLLMSVLAKIGALFRLQVSTA
jgi:mannose-6-phosphate isomerase-like protein (cupin superfamily)